MIYILFILLFALQLLIYSCVYYILFSMKIKTNVAMIVSFIAYMLVAISQINDANAIVWMTNVVMVLGFYFLMREKKILTRLLHLLTLFFFITCFQEIFALFFDISEATTVGVVKHYVYVNILSATVFALGIVGKILSNVKRVKGVRYFISQNMHFIVVVASNGILATVAALNYSRKYVDAPGFQALALFLCGYGFLTACVLCAFTIYIKQMNGRLEETIKIEAMIKEAQHKYYTELLERENDTRKYRHDMINHLVCIDTLLQDQEYESICTYIKDITDELKVIQKRCYDTGNNIISALTNYYLADIDSRIKVEISGHLSDLENVGEVQICNIYGNLIKNAVEEIEREKELENPYISINFQMTERVLGITIKNSAAHMEKNSISNDFMTSKDDKKNHGLGFYNVRKALSEVGGEIELNRYEDEFVAKVMIKL